jgi:hypothetical protein
MKKLTRAERRRLWKESWKEVYSLDERRDKK